MTAEPPSGFAEEILRHYRTYNETERLASGDGLLELLRTRELLLRHLGNSPATIVDVGGGPGAYAVWLAELGHQVHLVDPVPEHIEQAKAAAAEAGVALAALDVADGRDLPIPDGTADAVLVMGPLYHLQDVADRLVALQEANRVLKEGGLVFAAAISRFASSIDGLWSGWIDDPVLQQMVERVIATGKHVNPTDNIAYFTTSYFHHPLELHRELEDAGFTDVTVSAVEGIGWAAKDLDARLEDPVRRESLLAFIRKLETEPSILGASPHLLAIGRSRTS